MTDRLAEVGAKASGKRSWIASVGSSVNDTATVPVAPRARVAIVSGCAVGS